MYRPTKPWVTFWLTLIFVGVLNVAFEWYLLSRPEEMYIVGKRGDRGLRDIDPLFSGIWMTANLPVLLLAGCMSFLVPLPKPPWSAIVVSSISPFVWAIFAMIRSRHRNR